MTRAAQQFEYGLKSDYHTSKQRDQPLPRNREHNLSRRDNGDPVTAIFPDVRCRRRRCVVDVSVRWRVTDAARKKRCPASAAVRSR